METGQLELHAEVSLMTTTDTGREIKKERQQWTQKNNHCTACNAWRQSKKLSEETLKN